MDRERDYEISHQGFSSLVTVLTFDLYHGYWKIHHIHWGSGITWESLFDGLHAGLMYQRGLSVDESYWWSG